MGILEKLRPQPRWKHADPSVRVAAVYELGPDDNEALHALAREDAEPRVRRAAVTRIDEVAVLGDIARTDPDEDVRAEAVRGLAGIAAEADDPGQAIEASRQLLALGRTKEIVLIARDSSC
jgi:HEAT repeat protein